MATMNISLPDQMKDWVDRQAKGGQYSNVSDYVRDLIRRDQAHRTSTKQLQELISEGVQSGPAEEFDIKDFIASKLREDGTKT